MSDDDDLRRTLDAIGDLVCRRGADGRIVYVNAAFRRAFGGRFEDWAGRWFAVMPADASGARDGRRRFDSAIDTVAGPAAIEWEATPLPDGGDITIGRDVSARRAGESALRDARRAAEAEAKARQSLFSSMTHELRTPLNGVLGVADLLSATPLQAEQRAYVEAIRQSGRHLLGLVEDVLDAAKLEAGAVDLADDPLDPAELLEGVVELLAVRAREKGLDLSCDIDPAAGALIRGDAGRLRQIALNLIGNAVKFTEHGGVVASLTRRASDDPATTRLELCVRDTGPGVPEGDRTRIFEAFAQSNASPKRKSEGAGLGLAIVSRLVTAMGGEIRLDTPDGGGAAFIVSLKPRLVDPAEAPRSDALAGVEVLVAAGPIMTRQALSDQLTRLGATARSVGALDELRAAVVEQPEALVIVDGADAMAWAGAAARARAALVLVAPDQRARLSFCLQAGYAGWIIKPWRRATLIDRLGRAAAGERFAPPEPDAAPTAAERRRVNDRRRAQRSAAQAPSQTTAKPASVGARPRVLLVEDNPVNRLLALALLKRRGVDAEVAETGEAAVEKAAGTAFDLILMDMRLPGLDGPDAARALRAKGIATPIVALTANAADADRRACLDAGMDGFLTKPIDDAAFAAALERWTKPAARANLG